MFKIFLQPYPLWDNTPRKILVITGFSVLVFLFMYAFKPYALDHLDSYDNISVYIGYGVINFTTLIFMQLIIPSLMPSVLNEDKWNVYKEILFTMIIISCLGLVNMLYTTFLGSVGISGETIVYFETFILGVTLVPVTIAVIIKQNYLLMRNLKLSSELSERLYRKSRMLVTGNSLVNFNSGNPDDKLILEASDIFYLAAAEHSVEVHVNQNNRTQKIILQSTLKDAQSSLKRFSNFYRCHRAYIVNLDKVQSVTGNSQGYKLILFDTEKSIPVSRSLAKEVTQRICF